MQIPSIRLLTDTAVRDPQRDYLDFKRYVAPLVDVLTAEAVQTPLTIGIFGPWGSGKSTVILLTDAALERESEKRFVRVHFNAWLHRKEPNILIPLIHTLRDTLAQDKWERFKDAAAKIGEVLARLSAGLFLKSVTLGKVSVDELEKLEKAYREEKGMVESTMRNLHGVLQAQANDIHGKGARLVFFIDDLDRCDPDQIIDLLDSIKLFLDLEHAFFVIAADKEVIDSGVEVKFGKFRFAEGRIGVIGAEYLEKMVQVPLQLLPLFPDQIGMYVRGIAHALPPQQQLFLASVVAPNPRKVKRILNAFALVERFAGDAALKADVLLRMVVLQIQSGDVYWPAAKEPKVLTALERAFVGDLDVNDAASFAMYGNDLRDIVQDYCIANYKPGTFLSKVFEGAPFAGVGDQLQDYFAVVGH